MTLHSQACNVVRVMNTRYFTQCPECDIPFTAKGMGRHRTAIHGVPAQQPRRVREGRKPRTPLAERLARIDRGEV